MERRTQPAGNYHYATGIAPYSAGVIAADGHHIVRLLVEPGTRWREGFEIIDQVLAEAGRPPQALCSVELRCPTPHSFGGFGTFNDDYRRALADRSILLAGAENPVARTNVAPEAQPVSDTELHAFGFTLERQAGGPGTLPPRPSFIISGAGDLHDQSDLRPEAIVGGDRSWEETGALRAAAVMSEMETRLAALQLSWADTDEVVLYAVDDVGAVVRSVVLPALGPAARRGVHWHQASPPIAGLRFEMDTRGGVEERRQAVPSR